MLAPTLLTIADAAAYLSIGETFFRKDILPGLQKIRIRSRILVPRSELDAWVQAQLATSSHSEDPSGMSDGNSAGTVAKSALGSEIAERLRKSLATSTRRRSNNDQRGNVVPIRERQGSTRRKSGNG